MLPPSSPLQRRPVRERLRRPQPLHPLSCVAQGEAAGALRLLCGPRAVDRFHVGPLGGQWRRIHCAKCITPQTSFEETRCQEEACALDIMAAWAELMAVRTSETF